MFNLYPQRVTRTCYGFRSLTYYTPLDYIVYNERVCVCVCLCVNVVDARAIEQRFAFLLPSFFILFFFRIFCRRFCPHHQRPLLVKLNNYKFMCLIANWNSTHTQNHSDDMTWFFLFFPFLTLPIPSICFSRSCRQIESNNHLTILWLMEMAKFSLLNTKTAMKVVNKKNENIRKTIELFRFRFM